MSVIVSSSPCEGMVTDTVWTSLVLWGLLHLCVGSIDHLKPFLQLGFEMRLLL